MNCPEAVLIEKYVSSRLDGIDLQEFETHLTTCSSCTAKVAEAKKDEDFIHEIKNALPVVTKDFENPQNLAAGGGDKPGDVFGADKMLLNRYHLIHLLGHGGMGEVWLAEDRELGLQVAIKRVPRQFLHQPSFLKALEAEARIAMKLTHPNIVRLYNLMTEASEKFIVMEYVPGITLAELIARRGKLTLTELEGIADGIALALDCAHTQGVLHRDIKPGNIMVEFEEKEDEPLRITKVKVLDFGIARVFRDTETFFTNKSDTGTRPYMAPELFQGQQPSKASDIYAFGVTLYECLAGKPPFHTGPIDYQILHAPPPEIPGIPLKTQTKLNQALAKIPKDRPASCQQVVDRLLERPDPVIRFRPPIWGNKRFRIAAITLIVMILALSLWYFWPKQPIVNLTTAVKAAKTGSILSLSAESYSMADPLIIDKPLSLIGAGDSKTIITCRSKGWTIKYVGKGQLVLKDLRIQHEGNQPADVIIVEEGEIEFSNNTITGGVREGEDKQNLVNGSGLRVTGSTTGIITRCTFTANQGDGITFHGQANLNVRENKCFANGRSGIVFYEKATGNAERNVCENNEMNGMEAGDFSSPMVKGNTCNKNKLQGIAVSGNAVPILDTNRCGENGQTGIMFVGNSRGKAVNNECTANKLHGMVLRESSSPEIRANTCKENKLNGIVFFDNVSTLAVENICENNSLSGMVFTDKAIGKALRNRCEQNETNGIALLNEANPELFDNRCFNNKQAGILFSDNARGKAVHNFCSRNGDNGISIEGNSNATLDQNTCSNNFTSGISFSGNSLGKAVKNLCELNKFHGIAVFPQASTLLEGNVLNRNNGYGIFREGGARPEMAKNVFSENQMGNFEEKRIPSVKPTPAIDSPGKRMTPVTTSSKPTNDH